MRDFPDFFLHQEVQHRVFLLQLNGLYLYRIRNRFLHIIDPYICKVAGDYPPGAFRKRDIVVVSLCLFKRSQLITAGLMLLHIEPVFRALLLYQDFHIRYISIDIPGMDPAISLDQLYRLLKRDIVYRILYAKDILQKSKPESVTVLFFISAISPFIRELSCSLSLLCISHLSEPSIEELSYFPILQSIATSAEAMDPANARRNLTATAEQAFRLYLAARR